MAKLIPRVMARFHIGDPDLVHTMKISLSFTRSTPSARPEDVVLEMCSEGPSRSVTIRPGAKGRDTHFRVDPQSISCPLLCALTEQTNLKGCPTHCN